MITLDQAQTEIGTIMDILIGEAGLEPAKAAHGVMKTLEGLHRRIGDPTMVTIAYVQNPESQFTVPSSARDLALRYTSNEVSANTARTTLTFDMDLYRTALRKNGYLV